MGTAAQMLSEARRSLGVRGRPNYITQDYARRHGNEFLRAAWCDMAVTYWARASGTTAAVLPGGDRAYTVWHAQDFQKIGRWYSGTTANVDKAKPGDIVFFDWGESNSVGAIDHVGVVEKVLGGGRLQTIEGNTSDACLRRVRSSASIAGYGRPAYSGSSPKPSEPVRLAVPDGSPLLRRGSTGGAVRQLQKCLNHAGLGAALAVDGDFGPKTEAAVKTLQRAAKIAVDGIYGPDSARALRARVT